MIAFAGSRSPSPSPACRRPATSAENGDGRPAGRRTLGALSLVLSALLVACGGGSGDGDNDATLGADMTPSTTTGAMPDGQGLIIGEAGGRDASALSDDELRRRASLGTARGTGIQLPKLPLMADADVPFVGNPDTELDPALVETAGAANQTFANHLLGVDDPDAVVLRSGNLITIDPDDAALCEDDYGLGELDDDTAGLGGAALPADDGGMADCLRIMSDITVELNAMSEDSGVVTVLFAGTPVLAQGYSPGGARSEVYLAGVQNVLMSEGAHRVAQGEAITTDLPEISGTLRLDARVLDETLDGEVVELEMSVAETLAIDAGEPGGITLEPSRVFLIGNDAATGQARLSVAWGALRIVSSSGDSDGNRSTNAIDLGGLTFDLSAVEGGSTVSLQNVGIGDVPFTVTVNEGNALSLALQTFGMTIDAEAETISVDTAAGVDLMIDNLSGFLEDRGLDYVANFVARVPAGTRFQNRGEGVSQVVAGGPVTASLVEADGTASTQQEVSALVGNCLADGFPDDDDMGALTTPGEPFDPFGFDEEDDDSLFAGIVPSVVECP